MARTTTPPKDLPARLKDKPSWFRVFAAEFADLLNITSANFSSQVSLEKLPQSFGLQDDTTCDNYGRPYWYLSDVISTMEKRKSQSIKKVRPISTNKARGVPIVPPPFPKGLNPETLLTTKEVCVILGIVNLSSALTSGRFPEPDKRVGVRVYWKVSTIKREHARRTHVYG